MGVLEEQARFLTVKYGTATGPVGVTHSAAATPDITIIMVLIGLLIFASIMFLLLKDYTTADEQQYHRVLHRHD